MSYIQRTYYLNQLQTAMVGGVPHVVEPFTTLNEKLGISVPVNEDAAYPTVGYYAIGRGGHYTIQGPDGIDVSAFHKHRATDAALYHQQPFIMRELTDDLTVAQQANYGLRRTETHNNKKYICYYLKRLHNNELSTVGVLLTTLNGSTKSKVFVPDITCLKPIAPDVSNPSGVYVDEGKNLKVTLSFEISLTPWDIEELRNCANILFGDPGYAVISEITLVQGKNTIVELRSSVDTPYNFMEVSEAQPSVHISTHHPLINANTGISLSYDLGVTVPLTINEQSVSSGTIPIAG